MNELETEWRRRIAEAQTRARESGRADVAEYLLLRAENDAARAAGVEWLVEAFAETAGEANRAGAGLSVSREEEHRFSVGQSTMVGTRLTLRAGVRQLSVEAGWPRAPRDGIVRGGGLASARLSHFGRASANEDLLLVREGEGPPRWFVLEETGARTPLGQERVRRHVRAVLA